MTIDPAIEPPSDPKRPSTLQEFYAGRIKVGLFVKQLSAGSNSSFEQSDRDQTIAAIDSLDPQLRKTLSLATSVRRSRGQAGAASWAWLRQIADREFDGTWTESPSLHRAFDRYFADLTSLNKEKQRRGFNGVRLCLLLLARQDAIDPYELVGRAERLVEPTSDKRRNVTNPGRFAVEPFVRATTLAAFKQAFQSTRLWTDQAKSAKAEIRQAVEALETSEERVRNLRLTLTQVQEDLKKSQTMVAQLDIEKSELERRLQEAANSAVHDLYALKSRMRAFISDTVAPRLRDAHDALEMTPTRLDTARERIGVTLEFCEAEKTWLDSD